MNHINPKNPVIYVALKDESIDRIAKYMPERESFERDRTIGLNLGYKVEVLMEIPIDNIPIAEVARVFDLATKFSEGKISRVELDKLTEDYQLK